SQKTVTFDLSWKGSDASHRDEVWVFVDMQPITGVIKGNWTPATLVPNATTVTAGSGNQYSSLTYTAVSGNTRGVWVKGTSSVTTNTFNATVKVTLASGMPAQFNACAYASDYPPNAASYNGGTYTFKGTKPFIVNGTEVNDNQYAVTTITSLTDATGCPGGVERNVEQNNGNCLSWLTPCGGYCRDLAADNARCDATLDLEISNGYYSSCPSGWRYPTEAEAKKMHSLGYTYTAISSDNSCRIYCTFYSSTCAYCTYVGAYVCVANGANHCWGDSCKWSIFNSIAVSKYCVR
ncbi:MAG: hypothetical protein LBN98_06235, partial [Prevotellaceae bacterium]|nr:hypothetical protein [Prevotellaceae bacterium]